MSDQPKDEQKVLESVRREFRAGIKTTVKLECAKLTRKLKQASGKAAEAARLQTRLTATKGLDIDVAALLAAKEVLGMDPPAGQPLPVLGDRDQAAALRRIAQSERVKALAAALRSKHHLKPGSASTGSGQRKEARIADSNPRADAEEDANGARSDEGSQDEEDAPPSEEAEAALEKLLKRRAAAAESDEDDVIIEEASGSDEEEDDDKEEDEDEDEDDDDASARAASGASKTQARPKGKAADRKPRYQPGDEAIGGVRARDARALRKLREGGVGKNRLGQRERRRLAEAAFGRQSHHFGKRMNPRGSQGSKRPPTEGKERPSAGPREKKAAPAPPKEDTANLHPSWQAKRREAERGVLIASAPASKKIVFDD
ncbi:hypothetical protein QBZ16_001672 [Prototheca wickerhamii]|uniref:Bud22 domain-containing protein n=1 Tax=Prototheca wickerhamii TaxID=3111 RepID=A0AAD9IEH5_PROWI|nr:hypothetical protein QBZ16_001672 [Prototheca wickerhamii]